MIHKCSETRIEMVGDNHSKTCKKVKNNLVANDEWSRKWSENVACMLADACKHSIRTVDVWTKNETKKFSASYFLSLRKKTLSLSLFLLVSFGTHAAIQWDRSFGACQKCQQNDDIKPLTKCNQISLCIHIWWIASRSLAAHSHYLRPSHFVSFSQCR